MMEKKENILALFIDFKKAFDLIDHELLFRKLIHYGFDNNSLIIPYNGLFLRKDLASENRQNPLQ